MTNGNFIFSGIGSDYRDLVRELNLLCDADLKNYISVADKTFGFKLSDYLEGRDVSEPVLCSWVAHYTLDCVVYDKYRKLNIKPNMMLGYSMGLITALKCGNSISYEDGIRLLIRIRNGHRVDDPETMVAVIGLEEKMITDLLHRLFLFDDVFIASKNNDTCYVLSGMASSVKKLIKSAEKADAYISKIDSDYAFHTVLMKDCGLGVSQLLDEIRIQEMDTPIMSAYDQRLIREEKDIKNELVINLYSKMNWSDSILTMFNSSPAENMEFYEVGLEDGLSKGSQKVCDNAVFNIFSKVYCGKDH